MNIQVKVVPEDKKYKQEDKNRHIKNIAYVHIFALLLFLYSGYAFDNFNDEQNAVVYIILIGWSMKFIYNSMDMFVLKSLNNKNDEEFEITQEEYRVVVDLAKKLDKTVDEVINEALEEFTQKHNASKI